MKEEKKIRIEKQDHSGNGIGKIENKVVFVEKALPEELCSVELQQIKKNFMTARVTEIITSSKDRVTPECPYFEACGGCDLLHQKMTAQRRFKQQKIQELLLKFAGIKKEVPELLVGKETQYRNKVTIHKVGGTLGFYRGKSNQIVSIETCLLLEPILNKILFVFQQWVSKNPERKWKEIMIRTSTTKETMVSIQGETLKKEWIKQLESLGVTTILVNQKVIFGSGIITEKILDQSFQISAPSFFQVNTEMMKVLYQETIEIIKKQKSKVVLDLYCGTGTIGILIAPYVDQVIGIEIEPAAILNANQNKENNQIQNIEFISGAVEQQLNNITNVDTIIVDPPRAGLDPKTIESIKKINPQTLLYISCDPATLARDIKEFKEEYSILHIQPIDMFPNTQHVETIVWMSKKEE